MWRRVAKEIEEKNSAVFTVVFVANGQRVRVSSRL
nr:MAG TPA: Man1-Src1p-C-terminal domain [Caudoviricetes sp.]